MKNTAANVIGFPSSFAALKYFDQCANGPVSWRLNGHPGVYVYDPDQRADDLAQEYADSIEPRDVRCVW